MRNLLLTAMLLATTSHVPAAEDPGIVGKWANGSVFSLVEFAPDATFHVELRMGRKMEGTWQMDGTTLSLTFLPQQGKGSCQVKFAEPRMTMSGEGCYFKQENVGSLIRLPATEHPADAKSLIGAWANEAVNRVQFLDNGNLYIEAATGRTDNVKWELLKEIKDQNAVTGAFRILGPSGEKADCEFREDDQTLAFRLARCPLSGQRLIRLDH